MVTALVRFRIRVYARLQQGQTERGVQAIMPVLAVVHQADAEVGFGKIRPAVPGNLKTSLVPTGVAMRRLLDPPKCALVLRLSCSNVEWERRFEQHLMMMPVNARLEVDTREVGIDQDALS